MKYEEPTLINLNTVDAGDVLCGGGSQVLSCHDGGDNHSFNCEAGSGNDVGGNSRCESGGANVGRHCSGGSINPNGPMS